MSSEVVFAVEGETDVPVAEKLILQMDRTPRRVLVSRGKAKLDARLMVWNQVSNRIPFLVLRDWDASDGAACVPELLKSILGGPVVASGLIVRVPVRAIESWLMADHEMCSDFFATNHLPSAPDEEADAKQALVNACRRSKQRKIREAMVPRPDSHRRVGPLYEALILEFGRDHWNIERARSRSPSLDRALQRLSALVAAGIW